MNAPQQPVSPRRRLQELLSIPDSQRTDEQWDELNELEIKLAPGNRDPGNRGGLDEHGEGNAPRHNPHNQHGQPRNPQGGGGGGGGAGGPGGGQQPGRGPMGGGQPSGRGPMGKRPARKFHKRPKPPTP